MTLAIYKYTLPETPTFEIELPNDADVFSVQVQRGKPVLWANIELDRDGSALYPLVKKRFRWIATGQAYDHEPGLRFVATLQIDDQFVLHLFERR